MIPIPQFLSIPESLLLEGWLKMNIRRALTYTFHDPEWVTKLGIAMLLNLLPVAVSLLQQWSSGSFSDPARASSSITLGWDAAKGLVSIPLYGYVLRIARNVVQGSDLPLPTWHDRVGILRDGLKLWGVLFLWGLPAALFGVVPTLEPNQFSYAWLLTLPLGAVMLLILVVQPAAEARLAATGSFTAGIDVPTVLRIVRRNRGRYLRLMLVTFVVGGLALAIVFGPVWVALRASGRSPELPETARVAATLFQALLGPFMSFVLYHLNGQVYVQATRT